MSALPTQTMSARSSSRSWASALPVRQKPVAISSWIDQGAVRAGQPAEVVDAAGRPRAHAAGSLQQRLDDHRGDLVGVLLEQVGDRRRPRRRSSSSSSRGGSGAKTCSGTMPAYMLCMPPSGSQTLIGEKVSPW